MLEELNGKSVLITGATTAIGAAVPKGFSGAAPRSACTITAAMRRPSRSPRRCAVRASTAALLQGDVTDHADVARIIEAHSRTFGRLDVLINNAGDVGRRSPFEELSEQLIDDTIALNARSVVTACRLTVPLFHSSGPR